MRRDQLEHAIRTACQIIGQPEVIVVGSQAILGTYPEYELPSLATRSLEIDILPITDDNDETMRLADLIVGVAGEFSPFEQTPRLQHRRRRSQQRQHCLRAGERGWSRYRMRTRPPRAASRSTSAGALTRKTSA